MADELDLNLSQEEQNINKTEERIRNLSSKVKTASEERDAAAAKAAEAEAARIAAEKERDFYAGFTDMTGKYQGASEFKDTIKEKVLGGYTMEDATVAVLNANGRLVPQAAPPPPPPPPAAGGSALNPSFDSSKGMNDMNREERRAALIEAEKRGDISLS